MRPIRLVFISTHAVTRRGIAQIVMHSEPPVEVVGTFSDFLTARSHLDANPVEVILIDEALPPNTDLLRSVKELCVAYFGIAVIVILPRPTIGLVQQLLAFGVRGILHKGDDLDQYLVQAIILGKQRGIYLSPAISHFIDTPTELPAALNQRDFDVLTLLVDGLEPKEIALHIGAANSTVYRILRSIRYAFHVQNNAQLITIVHQRKLFISGDRS